MKKLRITVDGKPYEVTVEVLEEGRPQLAHHQPTSVTPPVTSPLPPVAKATEQSVPQGALPSPIAGKVVSVDVVVGQAVEAGMTVVTLESMKMNTFVSAPSAGTVGEIHVKVGEGVEEGHALVTLV
jgi:glutaconyl-CoA/methylmalonyl-CoA decarboxylase subunit gamma